MINNEKKLVVERSNRNRIYLHKERLFWVAYERSAYLFVSNVKAYQVQKRIPKTFTHDVVSVAFPDAVIKNIDLPVVRQTDELIVFKVPRGLNVEKFAEWREAIPKYEKHPRGRYVATTSAAAERLMRRLAEFDVTSSTPIDCMNLIVDMKRQIA